MEAKFLSGFEVQQFWRICDGEPCLVQTKSVTLTQGLEEGLEPSAAREDGALPVSAGPCKGQALELSCEKLKNCGLRWSLII